MTHRRRFLASVVAFGVALALSSLLNASEARAELGGGTGYCDEFQQNGVTVHQFAGGACYFCAPNTCHSDAQSGYCGEYHYSGATCQ